MSWRFILKIPPVVNGLMQGWYRNPKLEDNIPVAQQKSVDITATKTAYSFNAGGVRSGSRLYFTLVDG